MSLNAFFTVMLQGIIIRTLTDKKKNNKQTNKLGWTQLISNRNKNTPRHSLQIIARSRV